MSDERKLAADLGALWREVGTGVNAAIERATWQEYDDAATYVAKRRARGVTGTDADLLPLNLSRRAYSRIADDPEAFEQRVKDTAYAQAMEGVMPDE